MKSLLIFLTITVNCIAQGVYTDGWSAPESIVNLKIDGNTISGAKISVRSNVEKNFSSDLIGKIHQPVTTDFAGNALVYFPLFVSRSPDLPNKTYSGEILVTIIYAGDTFSRKLKFESADRREVHSVFIELNSKPEADDK